MSTYEPRDGDQVNVAMTIQDDGSGTSYLASPYAVIVPRCTADLIEHGHVTLVERPEPEATS